MHKDALSFISPCTAGPVHRGVPDGAAVVSMNVLRVCATPDAGFWTIDGDATSLAAKIQEHGGNYSLPCSRIGSSPETDWSLAEASDFPVTGFAAEMLLQIVANMGVEWDCVVSFLPSYTATLYATTKQQVCDVGFVPYGVTAPRAYCAETPPTTTSTPACPAYDPAVTWAEALPSEACCASYNYNMMVTSVAGLVVTADNTHSVESGLDWNLMAEVTNLLSWFLVVVLLLGHLIWCMEKTDPGTNLLHRDYVNGVFDAVWAVSSGFKDVRTTCARLLAMVYNYGSLAFFAVLTGTLSSVLTSARLQTAVYKWNLLQDVPRETVICCPAPAYLEQFEILQFAQSYFPADNSLDSCLRDLDSGVCDVVAYDEPTLHAMLVQNATLADKFQVLPGTDELVLASAFSGERATAVKGTFEQAIIEAQDQAEFFESLFFGTTDALEDDSADGSTSADDDNDDVAAVFDWVPIGILAGFTIFLFVANMIDNAVRGRLCVLVRLGVVCKNQAREYLVSGRLSVHKVATTVADLDGGVREVFELLEVRPGDGVVEETQLDVVAAKVAERLEEGGTGERDAYQVKSLLLEIFNSNVDLVITPEAFAAAYEKTLLRPSARELLLDIAKTIGWERDALDNSASARQAGRDGGGADIVPVDSRSRARSTSLGGRHRKTMLPPLASDQAQELAAMLRAACADPRWAGGRLPEAEVQAVVEKFGRRLQFSPRGIAKMTAEFLAVFAEHPTDEEAIAACTDAHQAVLAAARRGTVSVDVAGSGGSARRRPAVAQAVTEEGAPEATAAGVPMAVLVKMRELESLIKAMHGQAGSGGGSGSGSGSGGGGGRGGERSHATPRRRESVNL